MTSDVLIIGAGHNGPVCAYYLAARGLEGVVGGAVTEILQAAVIAVEAGLTKAPSSTTPSRSIRPCRRGADAMSSDRRELVSTSSRRAETSQVGRCSKGA